MREFELRIAGNGSRKIDQSLLLLPLFLFRRTILALTLNKGNEEAS